MLTTFPTVVGHTRLLRGLSFYDTELLEELFIEHFGRVRMLDLSDQLGMPKVRVAGSGPHARAR
jgi:hypothetical protein